MGLETGDFLDDLVETNPVTATDPVTEGSNHLRLIKKVLLATFPNYGEAVTISPAQLNVLTDAALKAANETIGGAWIFSSALVAESTINVTGLLTANGGAQVNNSTSSVLKVESTGTFCRLTIEASGSSNNVNWIEVTDNTMNMVTNGGIAFTISDTQNIGIPNGTLTVNGLLTASAGIESKNKITITTADVSTPIADDQGQIGVSIGGGLQLIGQGGTTDLEIFNGDGTRVITITSSTTTVNLLGAVNVTGLLTASAALTVTTGALTVSAGVITASGDISSDGDIVAFA